MGRVRKRHRSAGVFAAFSALAEADQRETNQVIDFSPLKTIRVPSDVVPVAESPSALRKLSFSPDSSLVAFERTETSDVACMTTVDDHIIGTKSLASPLRDLAWFPLMSEAPNSRCVASSAKDLPVQLWDLSDVGRLRATYSPSSNGEFPRTFADGATNVVAFDSTGNELWGGCKSFLVKWVVERPARAPERVNLFEHPGVVSDLRFSADEERVIVATHGRSVASVYDVRTLSGECAMPDLVVVDEEATSAIVQAEFVDGSHLVVTASRSDDVVNVWDLRMLSSSEPLRRLARPRGPRSRTRCRFAVSSSDRSVIVGRQEGDENVVVRYELSDQRNVTMTSTHKDFATLVAVDPNNPREVRVVLDAEDGIFKACRLNL